MASHEWQRSEFQEPSPSLPFLKTFFFFNLQENGRICNLCLLCTLTYVPYVVGWKPGPQAC